MYYFVSFWPVKAQDKTDRAGVLLQRTKIFPAAHKKSPVFADRAGFLINYRIGKGLSASSSASGAAVSTGSTALLIFLIVFVFVSGTLAPIFIFHTTFRPPLLEHFTHLFASLPHFFLLSAASLTNLFHQTGKLFILLIGKNIANL